MTEKRVGKRKEDEKEEEEEERRVQSCDIPNFSSYSSSLSSSFASFADKLPQKSRFSDSTPLDLARTRDTIDLAILPLPRVQRYIFLLKITD